MLIRNVIGVVALALAGCSTSNGLLDAPAGGADARSDASTPDGSTSDSAVGTILNGDFEHEGGWTSTGMNGLAEIKADVGVAGSHGGHLEGAFQCDLPALTTSAFPPSGSLNALAIQFELEGTPDETLWLQADKPAPSLEALGFISGQGTKSFTTASVCVPEHLKESMFHLTFTLPWPLNLTCDPRIPRPREFIFDNVRFATDPKCPTPAYLIDGGFEHEDVVTTWLLEPGSNALATIDATAANARTGTHSLMMQTQEEHIAGVAVSWVTIPPSDSNGGPVLNLWYKAPTGNRASLTVAMTGIQTPLPDVVRSADYQNLKLCIDLAMAGANQPQLLQLAWFSQGGGPSSFPPEAIWIDDLELKTDPSCPR